MAGQDLHPGRSGRGRGRRRRLPPAGSRAARAQRRRGVGPCRPAGSGQRWRQQHQQQQRCRAATARQPWQGGGQVLGQPQADGCKVGGATGAAAPGGWRASGAHCTLSEQHSCGPSFRGWQLRSCCPPGLHGRRQPAARAVGRDDAGRACRCRGCAAAGARQRSRNDARLSPADRPAVPCESTPRRLGVHRCSARLRPLALPTRLPGNSSLLLARAPPACRWT